MIEKKMDSTIENENINTTAEVYKILKTMILQNRFAEDKKFNQGKIAKELGVSRTPVVKALHKLESEGLVDNIPQRGFYVHKLNLKELLELFTLREALEGIVAKDLAETITDSQINTLENLFKPFAGEWTKKSKEDYREADRRFHDLQFAWCSNHLVKKVDEVFQVMNRTYLGGLVRDPAVTLQEHRAIISAYRSKDRELIVKACVGHISETTQLLKNTMENMKNIGLDPETSPLESSL